MRLTNQDREMAMGHIEEKRCTICNDTNFKVAPVTIDMLQQGSKLIENDYVLFSLVAFQCETCKHVEFFNRIILKQPKQDEESNESPATA